ncbi:jerky-like protein [Elysia marginata]|uniref:Jerky-like protein n=1 Tax=Elysia marginata TaxID=1093978 RepID=A0AAV4FZ10_9GAST|nr:jerky-like protein [Elysia marginata]
MVTDQPEPASGAGSPSGSGSTTAGPSTAAEGAPKRQQGLLQPQRQQGLLQPQRQQGLRQLRWINLHLLSRGRLQYKSVFLRLTSCLCQKPHGRGHSLREIGSQRSDSPVKRRLVEASSKTKAVSNLKTVKNKAPARGRSKGKGKGKACARLAVIESSSSEDEENICMVCCESFDDSRPGEKWIKCCDCGRWSHLDCTAHEGKKQYICDNCLSESL